MESLSPLVNVPALPSRARGPRSTCGGGSVMDPPKRPRPNDLSQNDYGKGKCNELVTPHTVARVISIVSSDARAHNTYDSCDRTLIEITTRTRVPEAAIPRYHNEQRQHRAPEATT
eukprot:6099103-Pyramimonas_sp.AAC.1